VEVVDPDAIDAEGGETARFGGEVGFYVPRCSRGRRLSRARRHAEPSVVQHAHAGVDLLLPHRAGWRSCSATPAAWHDASAPLSGGCVDAGHDPQDRVLSRRKQRRSLVACLRSLARGPDRPDRRPRLDRSGRARLPVRSRQSFGWPERSGPECARPPELPALLPQADVVVLLAPVTPSTIGMVDAAFLAGMKDGALLVNGARGTLVRTEDLVAELASGRLFAALDVTDPEPLPADHPLWHLPNALITPHAAAATWRSAGDVLGFLPRAGPASDRDRSATQRHYRRILSLRSALVVAPTSFLNRSVTWCT